LKNNGQKIFENNGQKFEKWQFEFLSGKNAIKMTEWGRTQQTRHDKAGRVEKSSKMWWHRKCLNV
jgi:hypothetical protein